MSKSAGGLASGSCGVDFLLRSHLHESRGQKHRRRLKRSPILSTLPDETHFKCASINFQ